MIKDMIATIRNALIDLFFGEYQEEEMQECPYCCQKIVPGEGCSMCYEKAK